MKILPRGHVHDANPTAPVATIGERAAVSVSRRIGGTGSESGLIAQGGRIRTLAAGFLFRRRLTRINARMRLPC